MRQMNSIGHVDDLDERRTDAPGPPAQDFHIRVLGRFEVISAHPISVGISCRWLSTLLALRDGLISRTQAAGTLWPNATAYRANANLRTVLWRLQRCCPGLIEATSQEIRLAPGVSIDIQNVSRVARQLLNRSVTQDPIGLSQALTCNLYEDIAPELDEEWLTAEREQYHQFRLHALESLIEQLIAAGWMGAAVETALRVIRADPFRESAYYLLIKAHLKKGNQIEAYRKYHEYCELIKSNFGLEPTIPFQQLLTTPATGWPGRILPSDSRRTEREILPSSQHT